MSNKLTVYSQPNCAPCRASKARLDREGIAYDEVDVTVDTEAAERLRQNGLQATPVFGWGGTLHTIADLPAIIREAATPTEAVAA
ncbi:glutaredoxin family protein [Agromyces larvae]|uniref:Glutaredoxin family protein n=1 Tax=Agromyces larvae TaxID=2929802 RepID=A0ABY4C3B9_9MICO|nr:glutaredoxin family protein [Agromyces larvae]UOE45966.1 glutaredoxin family protein [Agromyces larvae]